MNKIINIFACCLLLLVTLGVSSAQAQDEAPQEPGTTRVFFKHRIEGADNLQLVIALKMGESDPAMVAKVLPLNPPTIDPTTKLPHFDVPSEIVDVMMLAVVPRDISIEESSMISEEDIFNNYTPVTIEKGNEWTISISGKFGEKINFNFN